MLNICLAFVALLAVVGQVAAVPQKKGGGGGAVKATPQQQAASKPQGIFKADDGSVILDTNATVNGLVLRYKIAAPADQFTSESGVKGATAQPGAPGPNGINVLLHGDGGQSFFDFPNKALQAGLMGVVVLAPSEQLLWGQSKGQPKGESRADGAAHSKAVNDLIQKVLPQMVAFNMSNVFMTGVSGGALVLSGFFVPAHMSNYAGTGVLLMCGALAPQVTFQDAPAVVSTTKIHFQSTTQELTSLQESIPESIAAYEKLAGAAGLSPDQIGSLQTADNTPDGGHCEFDEKGFSSGIQLVSKNFASIMQGGDGAVPGIKAKTVLTTVVGNEKLKFKPSARGKKRATGHPTWIGA